MSNKAIDERFEDGSSFRIDPPKIKHYVQSLQLNVHHFYLSGEIEDDINKYSDLLNVLKTANEEDTIVIYINSEGGSLRMAIQIVNSMVASRAKVITSLDGDAHSAATLIFLSGEEYIINPNCSFMIHNYSGGFAIGKGHEIRTRVEHVNGYVEKIMRKFYEKILTEEEIDHVVDGRDIWMDSDQLIARLEAGEKNSLLETEDITPKTPLDGKLVSSGRKKTTKKKTKIKLSEDT